MCRQWPTGTHDELSLADAIVQMAKGLSERQVQKIKVERELRGKIQGECVTLLLRVWSNRFARGQPPRNAGADREKANHVGNQHSCFAELQKDLQLQANRPSPHLDLGE
jgi:hypothetical protein